jgi:hypothetical protein
VGEHDDLVAIVWHLPGKALVALRERLPEARATPFDGESAAAIGRPAGKKPRQMPLVPGEEEFRELLVVDRVGIARIGDPDVSLPGGRAGICRCKLRNSI